MKAMILAAGRGSRLNQQTENCPKALMQINDQPIIAYVVEHLRTVGVETILVNLHYLGEQIRDYFAKNDFGVEIVFNEDLGFLDTGGSIQHSSSFFANEECYWVYNCDIYTDFNLSDMLEEHKKYSPIASIAVSNSKSDRFLLLDSEMNLSGWQSSKAKRIIPNREVEAFDFNCIQIITPKLFQYFNDLAPPYSIFTPYMNAAEAGEQVKGFDIGDSYWIDIGTEESLTSLRAHLNE